MNKKKLPVTQEDDFGCGYACVAYLLGVSYKESFQFFENISKAKTGSYRCKFLADALNKSLVKNKITDSEYKTKYLGRIENPNIPDDSIVYINKNEIYKYGHYLVKTKYGYMNPFCNIPEVNGDSKKAKSKYEKFCPGKISLMVTLLDK